MAKKKTARKSTRKRKTSTKKRPTKKTKQKTSTNDCRSVFDARLTLASETPAARYSKGLDHDPTPGDVNASQFQKLVDQLKKLNGVPGQAAKSGFQLRSNCLLYTSEAADE